MNDFDKGFEFSARHAAAVPAGMDAASWVNSVEAAIEELYSAMNSYDNYKNSKGGAGLPQGIPGGGMGLWDGERRRCR